MKPKTSAIWGYFVEINESTAKCKICEKVYSRKGRTTTALKSHLKSVHVTKFEEFEKLDEGVKQTLEAKKQKRTEAQLKIGWDNLKTRPKPKLRDERQERLKTGGGPFVNPFPVNQQLLDDALLQSVDVEMSGVLDSDFNEEMVEVIIEVEDDKANKHEITHAQAEPRETISGLSNATTPDITVQGKNVRNHVISEEFVLRRENYKRGQDREEELHLLKVEELQYRVKASKENYLKVQIEKESAEELLRYNRAKREEAEWNLASIKEKQ